MNCPDTHAPVRIASSSDDAAELRWFAGLVCLFWLFAVAMPALRGGELGGLFFFALVAAGALAVARWIEHVTPEHAAVLYPDRLEIPRHAKQPQVVAWSDVTSICWPKTGGDLARIRIAVRNDVAPTACDVEISLKGVSPEDQLMVVEYLRRAGAGVEQQNWELFCQKRAVPLAEAAERRRDGAADATIAMPPWFRVLEAYPFLLGLLMPVIMGPLLVYVLPKLVSRTTYWILAAVIAASAFINIRLFWGRWASPFTEICLGTAAVCFLLGVFAAPEHSSKAVRSTRLPVTIAWYVPALIVCPFFVNATAIGWIPRPYDAVATLACFAMYLCAAHFVLRGKERRRKRRVESLRADAIRRWEVYETTRRLPPAADDEGCD